LVTDGQSRCLRAKSKAGKGERQKNVGERAGFADRQGTPQAAIGRGFLVLGFEIPVVRWVETKRSKNPIINTILELPYERESKKGKWFGESVFLCNKRLKTGKTILFRFNKNYLIFGACPVVRPKSRNGQ
jgi:hypothetical protein